MLQWSTSRIIRPRHWNSASVSKAKIAASDVCSSIGALTSTRSTPEGRHHSTKPWWPAKRSWSTSWSKVGLTSPSVTLEDAAFYGASSKRPATPNTVTWDNRASWWTPRPNSSSTRVVSMITRKIFVKCSLFFSPTALVSDLNVPTHR